MAGLPIFVSVDGAEKLKALSRDLKEAGRGDLKKQLRAEIRQAAKPVLSDVKRAALGADVRMVDPPGPGGNRSTGLRRNVAKATKLSITTTGVRFKVQSRILKRTHPPSLAKYLDASLGRYKRWRHPVFGNREEWVTQTGDPWFFTTIRRHSRDFRRAVLRAMDNVHDDLSK